MPSVPPNPENFLNTRLSPQTARSNPQSSDSVYTRRNTNLRSCTSCRRRKVRCNKETPCFNCVKNGVPCIFPPPGRARPTTRVRRTEVQEPSWEEQIPHLYQGDPVSSGQSPRHLPQVPGFQRGESESVTRTAARVPPTEAYDMLAQTTIDRQSQATPEAMSGVEQWIERCLYIGEGPPKSLYQLGRQSTASRHDCGHSSSLTKLTELVWHGTSPHCYSFASVFAPAHPLVPC